MILTLQDHHQSQINIGDIQMVSVGHQYGFYIKYVKSEGKCFYVYDQSVKMFADLELIEKHRFPKKEPKSRFEDLEL